jgi:DNA-directed RNA polymerase specialized sigma24 family protein
MHAIPDTTKRRDVERYLRKYMRREIERDLLGGFTSDQKEMQNVDAVHVDNGAKDLGLDDDLTLAQIATEAHVWEWKAQDNRDLIGELRALLSPHQQAVLDLRLEGIGWTQIAMRLGTTSGAARATWDRIKRKLNNSPYPP